MRYFTIPELCKSATADARKIKNVPNDEEKENLISLIENILDPIREKWMAPITVSSGFRCPELNDIVGGKKNSSHTTGLAADLQPKDRTEAGVRMLFGTIIRMNNLPFERVLLEHNKAKTTWWVHIAYDPSRPLACSAKSSQCALRIVIDDYESNR